MKIHSKYRSGGEDLHGNPTVTVGLDLLLEALDPSNLGAFGTVNVALLHTQLQNVGFLCGSSPGGSSAFVNGSRGVGGRVPAAAD